MPDGSLATAFLARLGGRFEAREGDLDELLVAALARARDDFPDVTLAPEELACRLADCVGHEADLEALAARCVHAGELLLTAACAAGDRRALAIIEERYLLVIAGHLRRFEDADLAAETLQRLRTRLFMAEGDRRPRILGYSGEGSLLGWLKVAVLRAAVDLRRGRQRAPGAGDEALDDELSVARDPELDYLKRAYREHFEGAVREALATLSEKERSLLRLYALDGLNIDEIGRVFRVHRATAARWIASCRERLRDETRLRLAERLGPSSSDLDSVLRLLESGLGSFLRSAL